ncbi:MAG: DUF5060 domain-containing protein [Catalinimonas sp.]
MWEPYMEWSITDNSFSGNNPYDVVARVVFEHIPTKKQHITEMFYAGDNEGSHIWKFRFTGTATGQWKYSSESQNKELDGLHGNFEIVENGDSAQMGFLSHRNNQYSMVYGNKGEVKPYRFMVFMDQAKFLVFDSHLKSKTFDEHPLFLYQDSNLVQAYIDEAANNAFDVLYFHPGYSHVWTDGTDTANGINPRIETFEILENMITQAHKQGKRLHIWMWGDQERVATPIPLKGGINGEVDQRLQRYIAARLGPLPGWSMGYGFDLHEWTNQQNLNHWAAFMHQHLGWDHLLSARGFTLEGDNNMNSYDGFGRNVELFTSAHGPKNKREVLEDMQSDSTRPHFYEERHSYKRPKFDLDMDGTRRLMWWQMLSGGMGGWYGFYGDGRNTVEKGNYPYQNPEQFFTAKRFWDTYIDFDMKATIDGKTELMMLEGKHKVIIYAEESDAIQLPEKSFAESYIAFDTKITYREIPFDKPTTNVWYPPYASDWVVVVR